MRYAATNVGGSSAAFPNAAGEAPRTLASADPQLGFRRASVPPLPGGRGLTKLGKMECSLTTNVRWLPPDGHCRASSLENDSERTTMCSASEATGRYIRGLVPLAGEETGARPARRLTLPISPGMGCYITHIPRCRLQCHARQPCLPACQIPGSLSLRSILQEGIAGVARQWSCFTRPCSPLRCLVTRPPST